MKLNQRITFRGASEMSILVLAISCAGLQQALAINNNAVEINIGLASWAQGGCPHQPPSYPPAEMLPVLHHKCDEIDVYGSGVSLYHTGTYPYCTNGNTSYAVFSFTDNGTQ